MEIATSLSQLGIFEPHGHCFLWRPDLILFHTVSDSITAFAYYSIPITLLYFSQKRRDLPYKWIFVLFSVFILACGTTHLMAVWTIWNPDYWLEGAVKAITAAASLVTAVLLWPMMPRLLQLPSPAQLTAANQELRKEIAVRKHAEAELSGIRQDLERQVQERTAELSQANAALRADIAERKRAEEELRRSEAYLAEAQRLSHTGTFGWMVSSGEIFWSNETFRIFEYDRATKPSVERAQATLAAVVIVYSIGLIQPADFSLILQIRRTEFLWALTALAGVVLLGTLEGILVAIVVSLVALAFQTADPPVRVLGRKLGTNVFRPRSEEHPEDETFPGLLMIQIEGRLFFANAERIREKMKVLADETKPRVLALDLSGVPDLEYTAL